MAVSARVPKVSRGFLWRYVVAPSVRAVTGLPLALAAVPLALTGQSGRAARWQLRVADRFGSPQPGDVPPVKNGARVLTHSLRVLIPSSLNFLLIGLVGFLVWSGYLYLLRPDVISALEHPFTADPALANAWGGPSLLGAWLVHSLVALGMQACCLVVIHLLCVRQGRVTAALLAGEF